MLNAYLSEGPFYPYNSGISCSSIVRLTSSLRGQLIKCFKTVLPNALIFLFKKMRESFALAKASHILSIKILTYLKV